MSTVSLTGASAYAGNDRLLAGIVMSVLTFWLFAQSVINVVPAMQNSLDIALETLTLAVSLSALFSGCFVVACGGFADKFGRMRLTMIGLILSMIGSGLLFISWEPVLFLLGRAIQGLSAACIMPATLALIKTWYEGKARQRAISFWVIGSWGGSGLSSFVGGAIATTLGWRWIFILSMVVALVALLLIRATPESRSPDACRHKLDITGLVSFVLMLVLFNLFISKGHSWGWSSSLSLLVLCGAVIALMCFVVTGRRKGDAALIDFARFKNRAYSASVFSNFLLNGCIGTMMIASIWLQQGHHLSPLQTGMMTLGYPGYRTGDDPGGRKTASALRRQAADDDPPAADRNRYFADFMHLLKQRGLHCYRFSEQYFIRAGARMLRHALNGHGGNECP